MTRATDTGVEVLFDSRLELAEAPAWDARAEQLVWVDILEGSVYRARLGAAAEPDRIDVGTHVGAALPSAVENELLLCVRDGFARFDVASARSTLVAAPLADRPLSRFNDAKVSPDGRAFGGTMPYRAGDEAAQLYRLDEGGRAEPILQPLSLSNGLGWSPDGTRIYLVDSGTSTVLTAGYDTRDGSVGPARTLIELDLPEGAMPDGMCVDDAGCLWLAIWGCGELRRFDPSGRLDRTIVLPVSRPTSACFAGILGDTMVVTSASYGLDRATREREPHAGSIFAFDPGVTGPTAVVWNPELIGL